MIKLSRLDVEIIFLVARYKKGYIGEVWHMTGPKSPSTWWSAQREIPRLLDVHAAADQRVCSPLNKTAFLRSATLLIEEISFYFIYGHNVRGGFLPSLPLRHFYWPSRISIIYFKPRFARTWNPDFRFEETLETFDRAHPEILFKWNERARLFSFARARY